MNAPITTPLTVPSTAMRIDSIRTIRRTRRSTMPTMRNSPSSRRRSMIDNDIVLTMPIRATTTLINSNPLTALIMKSKICPTSTLNKLPASKVMSGRRSVTASISSSTSDSVASLASMNAAVGAVSPTKASNDSGVAMLPSLIESRLKPIVPATVNSAVSPALST